MSDPPSEAWDFRIRAAEIEDESHRRPGASWVPPILTDLVLAARRTPLSCYYPFTSHVTLRFATGPTWWTGDGTVLPVNIGLVPGGGYVVYTRALLEDPAVVELETAGADEAVAKAEQLAAQAS
ncbi:hypothetical protein GCM10009665_11780 [Kitasatospora nipponensis]|uniref:Uncharacterized protein n=1 Tax=Kitasatospora nipponensis TaxID=258049 RepID=A0ABN1VWS6_9ACTN